MGIFDRTTGPVAGEDKHVAFPDEDELQFVVQYNYKPTGGRTYPYQYNIDIKTNTGLDVGQTSVVSSTKKEAFANAQNRARNLIKAYVDNIAVPDKETETLSVADLDKPRRH